MQRIQCYDELPPSLEKKIDSSPLYNSFSLFAEPQDLMQQNYQEQFPYQECVTTKMANVVKVPTPSKKRRKSHDPDSAEEELRRFELIEEERGWLTLREKQEMRRIKNKISAQKSRDRKKEHINKLECKVESAEIKNEELEIKNEKLKKQVSNCKTQILIYEILITKIIEMTEDPENRKGLSDYIRDHLSFFQKNPRAVVESHALIQEQEWKPNYNKFSNS